MTPVGHSLVGLSIGVLCMPQGQSPRTRAAFLVGFMFSANIPDFPIPGWGHYRYHISHSLFVSGAMIVAAAVLLRLWRRTRPTLGSMPVLLGGAAAWLSHLLLDSLYSHGRGLAVFWPFSTARFALPVPWLHNLYASPPPLDEHTVRVCLVEAACFLPLVLLAVAWKMGLRRGLRRGDERPG